MNSEKPKQAQPHRGTLVVLVLLFMVPILLAMWLRFGTAGWRPDTGNHGQLIEPPVSLTGNDQVDQKSGYWLMIQLVPGQCDSKCAALTDTLRRVRVALGKDAHRVKWLRAIPDSSLWRTLETRARGVSAGAVFLVDPRGFLMMRYAPGFDANGVLDDLEKLLRYSKVGVQ